MHTKIILRRFFKPAPKKEYGYVKTLSWLRPNE